MARARAIAWETLTTAASSLSSAHRQRLAGAWASRAHEEQRAVAAFGFLATELVGQGCDPAVLSLVANAVGDEARHADLCRRYALAAGDITVNAFVPARFDAPAYPACTTSGRVLRHMVEMCCLNETFTGVYLTEMLARATNEGARAAIESLLADEIGHGRAGWAYLASRAGDPEVANLAGDLPAIVVRAMAPAASTKEERVPAIEALGWLSPADGAAIYRDAFRDVVIPGFEAVGIDPSATVAACRDRGWIV